jgi:hypothetical protein
MRKEKSIKEKNQKSGERDINISGIADDEMKLDDIIIFAYKLPRDATPQYYVGKILDKEDDQYRVHFMKPKSERRKNEKWTWVYYDKEDRMEVHTNAKRYKYNIFDAWITRQEILMTNVMLTSN